MILIFICVLLSLSCSNQKSDNQEEMKIKENEEIKNILESSSSICEITGTWKLIKVISLINDNENQTNQVFLEINKGYIKKIGSDSVIYKYELKKMTDRYYKFNSGIHEITLNEDCTTLSIMYYEKERSSEIYKRLD